MKSQWLVSTGILLVALLPRYECRALRKGAPAVPSDGAALEPEFQETPQSLPVLLRMGEEYFLRLGNLPKNPAAAAASSSPISSSSHLAASALAGNFFRAAVQQLHHLDRLQQRSLEGAAGPWESGDDEAASHRRPQLEEEEEEEEEEAATAKEKRAEEPPISLDLTFHLLREVLEMARAEQMAKQAHSNRKLMETIGK